jgi:dTMP kinase
LNGRCMFLVLDGVDGAGKSTQLRLLAEWLRGSGHSVICLRDPGGTELGEKIRTILLDPASHISMNAETLLYLASRAQLVTDLIKPALDRGEVVLCDRFELSTIVYQGVAGGVSPDAIRHACELTRGDCVPDWTGILDLDPAAAAMRDVRERDRIERRGVEYFQKVRQGFRQESFRNPERVALIDADGDVDSVHQAIKKEVARVLARHRSS